MAGAGRTVALGLVGCLWAGALLAQEAAKPDPAAALFGRGWERHCAGDSAEAVKIYGEVAEKYPKSDWAARALGCMGWDLMILRRYDEAMQAYERVLREYPEVRYTTGSLVAGQCAYSIAHCLYAKGDIDQAMAALDKALALCPDARGGDNDGDLRSDTFLNMLENEDEREVVAKAMAAGAPADPGEYLYLRAWNLKGEEALKTFQKLLNQYPKHKLAAAALASTARWLSAMGMYDEAIARYRKVLDEFPEAQYLSGKSVAPRAAWALACCCYVKGDTRSAKSAFDFALEKYSDANVRGKLYGEVFLALVKKLEAADGAK